MGKRRRGRHRHEGAEGEERAIQGRGRGEDVEVVPRHVGLADGAVHGPRRRQRAGGAGRREARVGGLARAVAQRGAPVRIEVAIEEGEPGIVALSLTLGQKSGLWRRARVSVVMARRDRVGVCEIGHETHRQRAARTPFALLSWRPSARKIALARGFEYHACLQHTQERAGNQVQLQQAS